MLWLINELEKFCKENGVVFTYDINDQTGETRLWFSDSEGKRNFSRTYAKEVHPDIAFANTRHKLIDFFGLKVDEDIYSAAVNHNSVSTANGLSKNEYISLELTKAWCVANYGSMRTELSTDSLITRYKFILDKLNKGL